MNIMGMGGAKSDSKKEEIRGIFDSNVEDGASYIVLAGMHPEVKKNLLKEVRTFFNYIIDYNDSDDPEIVIIPTDSELSVVDEHVYCKKSEYLKAVYLQQTGSFEK